MQVGCPGRRSTLSLFCITTSDALDTPTVGTSTRTLEFKDGSTQNVRLVELSGWWDWRRPANASSFPSLPSNQHPFRTQLYSLLRAHVSQPCPSLPVCAAHDPVPPRDRGQHDFCFVDFGVFIELRWAGAGRDGRFEGESGRDDFGLLAPSNQSCALDRWQYKRKEALSDLKKSLEGSN